MKAAVYKSFGAWGDRVRFATDWWGSRSDICFPLLLPHYHAQIIAGCILRLWLCYILFILCISYKYCTKKLRPGQIIFVAGVILHTKKNTQLADKQKTQDKGGERETRKGRVSKHTHRMGRGTKCMSPSKKPSAAGVKQLKPTCPCERSFCLQFYHVLARWLGLGCRTPFSPPCLPIRTCFPMAHKFCTWRIFCLEPRTFDIWFMDSADWRFFTQYCLCQLTRALFFSVNIMLLLRGPK